MARLKSANFDERMTLVEHLDELRTRIIVSAVVLVLAVGFCFWQNHTLLEIANNPLPRGLEPLTFSPTEPFFTTVKLSFYGGILLALPILLYQLYAFVLPAFSSSERRVVLPMLLMCRCCSSPGRCSPTTWSCRRPSSSCSASTSISSTSRFGPASTTASSWSPCGVGILFQIPVGVLAVTRLGIVTPRQLAKNRRYAILIIAIVAMLLPGTDPVTMLICMAPLYLLFEFSVLLARLFGAARAGGRRGRRRRRAARPATG